MELKELSAVYMILLTTPGYQMLVQQLEDNLAGREKMLLMGKPDENLQLKLAKLQGFAECVALLKKIPEGSSTAFREIDEAERAIWGDAHGDNSSAGRR